MKKKSNSLWVKSPCTIGFPERNIVFEKVERFSVHSIYRKEEKSQYLINFRREIEECEEYKKKTSRKWQSIITEKKSQYFNTCAPKCSKKTKKEEVVERLTSNEHVEVDLIYDKNGNRSTFYTSLGESILRYAFKKSSSLISFHKKPLTGPKVYVSGSTRMDLSRPENFNPGPGSYFIDKKDTEEITCLFEKSLKTSTKKSNESVECSLNSTILVKNEKEKNEKAEKTRKLRKSRYVKFEPNIKSTINFKCSEKARS